MPVSERLCSSVIMCCVCESNYSLCVCVYVCLLIVKECEQWNGNDVKQKS